MLHTETVTTKTLELLTQLMSDSTFDQFLLVGGTSLSLQLGHRISVDLDLFSNKTFNENVLVDTLRTNYHFELDFLDKETVKGEIGGVKIDCIAHKYLWLNEPTVESGIRLASFYDLAAMKLNAIVGNGTRMKDFIDIAYLSNKISFNEMLNAYESKYRSNPVMVLKAISYFDDINYDEPIQILDKKDFEWKKIIKHLLLMVKSPDKIFGGW
ncbi:MAG TPA: nucleotidyl transferase AbiEii/AbiGii toxin family protein [Paludibacter sp.]